jgi:hypothetical protein
MNKPIICSAVVFGLLFALSGCAGGSPQGESQVEPEEPFISLISVSFAKCTRYTGDQGITIDLSGTVQNLSNFPIDSESVEKFGIGAKLLDSDGTEADYGWASDGNGDVYFQDRSIEKNETMGIDIQFSLSSKSGKFGEVHLTSENPSKVLSRQKIDFNLDKASTKFTTKKYDIECLPAGW